MFKRITLGTLAAVVTLTAQGALADSWRSRAYRDEPQYDYARVTHVEPIIRRVRVERPVRECYDETRYEEPGYRSDSNTAAKTILGAVIGGVIGHQIGGGRGKDIATAAGAVIGGAVGRNSAARDDDRYYGDSRGREYTVQRCETHYETTYEERIEGYDVEYRYNGRTYHTRTPYDPGQRIRIRVDVTPTYAP